MRRRGAHFFFVFMPDYEMMITHVGKELDVVVFELLTEIANDLAHLLDGDVARNKILHEALIAASAKDYQIATKSDVLRTQKHPDADRFQKRSANMIDHWIVA